MVRNYLGIDIGGTKIAGAIVDEEGHVVLRDEIPTNAQSGGQSVLKSAIELAGRLIGKSNCVAAIGVGAGGQIDCERGVVVSATEILPGWAGTDIKGSFEKEFGVRTAVDNDVNAFASGEIKFGAAKGLSNVVFIALGTGVGGAVAIDGKIYHGAHWAGAELGHMLLSMEPDARKDAGGMRGTFEAYCSGPGLVQTWREISGDYTAQLSAKQLLQQAVSDASGFAAQAGEKTGEYLGYGLSSLINIFDPEAVVIGGGLMSWDTFLLNPAIKVVHKMALRQCPIVRATLRGVASVVGAATLAMYEK